MDLALRVLDRLREPVLDSDKGELRNQRAAVDRNDRTGDVGARCEKEDLLSDLFRLADSSSGQPPLQVFYHGDAFIRTWTRV